MPDSNINPNNQMKALIKLNPKFDKSNILSSDAQVKATTSIMCFDAANDNNGTLTMSEFEKNISEYEEFYKTKSQEINAARTEIGNWLPAPDTLKEKIKASGGEITNENLLKWISEMRKGNVTEIPR